MKNLLNTIDEIDKTLKEKGYTSLSFPYVGPCSHFKTGITAYIQHCFCKSIDRPEKQQDIFPINMTAHIAATSTDEPYSKAHFQVVDDVKNGIKLNSFSVVLYESWDGGIRTNENYKINCLADIPTKEGAKKQIEEKWEKVLKKTSKPKKMKQQPQTKWRKI